MSGTKAGASKISEKNWSIIVVVIVVAVLIVLVWYKSSYVMSLVPATATSSVSTPDPFNGINALFSGLAFAGVIVAIILQYRELKLQRKELRETREVLKASEVALRAQAETQIKENDRQGMVTVIQILEAIREDRAFVRECIRLGKTWRDLPVTKWKNVDNVCRAFDIVGMFDNYGLVTRELIGKFYAKALTDVYKEFLASYVEDVREKRGPEHFWELVEFSKRAEAFAKKHPASRGRANSSRDR